LLLTVGCGALGPSRSLVIALRVAQFLEKRSEPGDGPLVAFRLAGPAEIGGVIGELALEAEAFAEPEAVWGVVTN
jgi:hypothetical protein